MPGEASLADSLISLSHYIHPVLQGLALLLALYAFSLGVTRFRQSILKHKVQFLWKKHTRVGIVAAILWVVGVPTGLFGAHMAWGGWGIVSEHFHLGVLIGILALFGLCSGVYLDKVKKRRKFLPLLHGGVNSLALVLVCYQVWNGIAIARHMLP